MATEYFTITCDDTSRADLGADVINFVVNMRDRIYSV